MFDDIGATGVGGSWGGMQNLPVQDYGLVLPSDKLIKTPNQFHSWIVGVETSIGQESPHHKPLAGNRQRLEKRAGGALTVEEAAYTLKRTASFAHSREAPKTAAYVESVRIDANYPNGGTSKFRHSSGSPKTPNDAKYFDYETVSYKEWTTGKRKDATVGRVGVQDAGTVERGEGGVPISVVASSEILLPAETESQLPEKAEAKLQDKITNYFYRRDQPLYKQPYVYYSIGLGIVGFLFWYRGKK